MTNNLSLRGFVTCLNFRGCSSKGCRELREAYDRQITSQDATSTKRHKAQLTFIRNLFQWEINKT